MKENKISPDGFDGGAWGGGGGSTPNNEVSKNNDKWKKNKVSPDGFDGGAWGGGGGGGGTPINYSSLVIWKFSS